MNRAYAHVHNGKMAIVTVDNEGTVRAYRVIKHSAKIEGAQNGTDAMAQAMLNAIPLVGNVNPDMMRAVEGAMSQAITDARS